MTKKTKLAIFSLCLVIMLAIVVSCVWVDVANNPRYYSYEQHLERVSALAEEHAQGSDFTIAPLYQDNEELFGFLVEYHGQREWCDIVKVHNPSFTNKIAGVSMYCGIDVAYMRYRIQSDATSEYAPNVKWGRGDSDELQVEENGEIVSRLHPSEFPNRLWEIAESGNAVYHRVSPYKLANVDGEKKYLLAVKQDGKTDYIPAVKRGDRYLNLISLQEFDYQSEYAENAQPTMGIIEISHKAEGNY